MFFLVQGKGVVTYGMVLVDHEGRHEDPASLSMIM